MAGEKHIELDNAHNALSPVSTAHNQPNLPAFRF